MHTVFGMQLKKENYEIYLADANNRIIVAEEDGRTVGCACIERQWNAFTDTTNLFIRNAAVDENYRRRGIYTRLNTFIWDIAQREHIAAIELTCADFRVDSQRFYLNHGYTHKKTKVFIREIGGESK